MDQVAFLHLMAGTTRGVDAVALGTLKLEGDVNLALAMAAWFGGGNPT
jgi:putative sterol carrier protein